jgi:hypothetical protein
VSRGLDAILERIKQSPSSTLVSRYLSLVAELDDEGEKARRALAVAGVIQATRPVEALNIAHMVYATGYETLAALDAMIKTLEARGRHGKAAVLRNEREKLEKDGAGAQANAGRVKPPLLDLDSESDDGAPQVRAATTLRLDGDESGERDDASEDETAVEPAPVVSEPVFAVKGRPAPRGTGRPQASRAAVGAMPWLSPNKVTGSPGVGPGRERIIVPPKAAAPDPASYAAVPSLGLDSNASLEIDRLFDSQISSEPKKAPARTYLPPRVAVPAPAAAPAAISEPAAAPPDVARAASVPDLVEAASQPTPSGAKLDLFAIYGKSAREAGIEAEAQAPRPASWRPEASPAVPATGLGAAVELFDHYWRQGFVEEARDVLVQTASVCGHEPWWQARHALVSKSAAAGAGRFEAAARPVRLETDDAAAAAARALAFGHAAAPRDAAPAMVVAAPPSRRIDWKSLYEELVRTAARQRLPVASPARRELLGLALAGKPLPEGFLKALAAVFAQHLTERARQLLWELVHALWSAGPDEGCYVLLKTLGLHDTEPRWLGLYLDALLATGRVTQVVPVLRRALHQSGRAPLLDWARIGVQRLPRAWDALGVTGFPWSEDEGIAALLVKLDARPKPRLRSLVAGKAPPWQAAGAVSPRRG